MLNYHLGMGNGDLVSRLKMVIIGDILWLIGVIILLTKSHDLPSTGYGYIGRAMCILDCGFLRGFRGGVGRGRR